MAAFNLPSIAKLTMTDELHLPELGERKIALFCCIPDSDKSLNYLVGMIYTQLIQTLYRQADRIHKGRLPVPVHCLMDEYANLSLPKDTFLSALATMLDAVENGRIEAVMVRDLEQISRNSYILVGVIEILRQNDVYLITTECDLNAELINSGLERFVGDRFTRASFGKPRFDVRLPLMEQF